MEAFGVLDDQIISRLYDNDGPRDDNTTHDDAQRVRRELTSVL